jgi:iron complex transport system substrate-binding protein
VKGTAFGLVLLLAVTGCGQRRAPAPPPGAIPHRIVSLAPSATEMLFAVGAGSRVVATDDFSNYPPEARRLPHVGGISTNYETVVSLHPDLVVGVADLQGAALARCNGLGLKTLALETTTLAKTARAMRELGIAVGDEEAGAAASERLERQIESVSRSVAHLPRVSTLFVAEAIPGIIVAGRGTYLDEVIRAAGGENATTATGYATLGREAQRATQPDVVLAGNVADAATLRKVWPYPARVLVMPRDTLARPGPRIGEGIRWLAGALHPEAART